MVALDVYYEPAGRSGSLHYVEHNRVARVVTGGIYIVTGVDYNRRVRVHGPVSVGAVGRY
ncbi:hypothetical protein D1872_312370 [compost metagenome]